MADMTRSIVYGRRARANGFCKDQRFRNGLNSEGTAGFSGAAVSVCDPEFNGNYTWN